MAFGNAVRFRLEGVTQMLNDLQKMETKVKEQVRATLLRELRSWLEDAKMLTPVDTGALQLSGRLNVGSADERNFSIVFGMVTRKGKFVDYAEHVHETHPTGAKFLERVVDARSPGLEDLLARDLEGVL